MHKHEEVRILPYSKEHLFNIVINIEKYSEFLPWCSSAKILQKIGADLLYADLEISYKSFKQKYTSEVKYSLSAGRIEVSKIRGPLSHLKNVWQFEELGSETKVSFMIELELKSKTLDKIVGFFFKNAYDQILNSFIKRAETTRN